MLLRSSLGKAKSYVRSISFLQMLNFLVFFPLVLNFLVEFQLHTQEDNASVPNRGWEWTFSSTPMTRMSFSFSVDVEGF